MLQAFAQHAHHSAATSGPLSRLQAAHADLDARRQGELPSRHPLRHCPGRRQPRRRRQRGSTSPRGRPLTAHLAVLPGVGPECELGTGSPDLGVQGRAHQHLPRGVRWGQALQGPRIDAPARHRTVGPHLAVHALHLPTDAALHLQRSAPGLAATGGRHSRHTHVLSPGELQTLLLHAAHFELHLRRGATCASAHLADEQGRGHAMRRQLAGPRCPAPGLAALEPPARHVHQGGPPPPGSARGGAVDLRGLAIQEHRPFGAWRAAEAHAHEARRPRRHGALRSNACCTFAWYKFARDVADHVIAC